jgi:hypothetical protein
MSCRAAWRRELAAEPDTAHPWQPITGNPSVMVSIGISLNQSTSTPGQELAGP